MKVFTLDLKNENCSLTAYIPDYSQEMPHLEKRPAIFVIPGGGYHMCSDREAEPVALAFLNRGYAAFVLRYSVGKGKAKFPAPLNDAEEALELIHKNADEWRVDASKIAAIGFSAGGHLCAALGTMGRIRPAACILGYPCILDSINPILAEPMPGLEDKVDENTPPAFIFASCEDNCVPIEHSLVYAAALNKNKIPFEIHIYEKGYHGFSVSDRVVYSAKEHADYNAATRTWVDMCLTWLGKRFDF